MTVTAAAAGLSGLHAAGCHCRACACVRCACRALLAEFSKKGRGGRSAGAASSSSAGDYIGDGDEDGACRWRRCGHCCCRCYCCCCWLPQHHRPRSAPQPSPPRHGPAPADDDDDDDDGEDGDATSLTRRYVLLRKPSSTAVDPLSSVPCGTCPVLKQCTPGGVVSPETCVYFSHWLQW